MARFLVVASVNADRIWTLADKLRPGARHLRTGVTNQIGGAGWYAANVLREEGHEVTLACVLGEDATGDALFERLRSLGIDTSAILRTPRTHSYDILVDPDGERTLVFGNAVRPVPILPDRRNFDGAYVNCWTPISVLPCLRAGAPALVQLPLRDRVGRYPGTHVVVSRSDMQETLRGAWARAQETTGGQVRSLIVTDGPSTIHVVTADREVPVPPGPPAPEGQITVGAGDTFAGHLIARLISERTVEAATAAAAQAASRWLATRPAPVILED